jgi:hypothetical protein
MYKFFGVSKLEVTVNQKPPIRKSGQVRQVKEITSISGADKKRAQDSLVKMIKDTNRKTLQDTLWTFRLFPTMPEDRKRLETSIKHTVKFSYGKAPVLSTEVTVGNASAMLDFDVVTHYGPLWKLVHFWYSNGLLSFQLMISVMDGSIYVTDAKVD